MTKLDLLKLYKTYKKGKNDDRTDYDVMDKELQMMYEDTKDVLYKLDDVGVILAALTLFSVIARTKKFTTCFAVLTSLLALGRGKLFEINDDIFDMHNVNIENASISKIVNIAKKTYMSDDDMDDDDILESKKIN